MRHLSYMASRQTLERKPGMYALARSERAYRRFRAGTSPMERARGLRMAILWLLAALRRPADIPSVDLPGLEERRDLLRLEWATSGGAPIGRRAARGAWA